MSALRGSCACGRNRYTIDIPDSSHGQARVFFDSSTESRWHHASPLTAWLRIPLDWYHSRTHAFFQDETPLSIQRTYTSPFTLTHHARRQFCGYCGTPLSSWHERTQDDAAFISVTLGSLIDEDIPILDTLGLLPTETSGDDDNAAGEGTDDNPILDNDAGKAQPTTTQTQRQEQLQKDNGQSGKLADLVTLRGAPWFEDLVRDSRLGSVRRRRGRHTFDDGKVQVQWEITEWEKGSDEDLSDISNGKRKVADLEAEGLGSQDVSMKEV